MDEALLQEAQRALAQPQRPYLTVAEAAKLLSFSEYTIRRLCREKKLEHVRIANGHIRIPVGAIRNHLERAR